MNKLIELSPPSGYYESTLNWVENAGLTNKDRLIHIYPQLAIPNVKSKRELLLLEGKAKFSNKAFVVIMPNGRVLGERAVISTDHKLLWDVSVEWARTPKEHSIFEETSLPQLTKTNETIAVLNHPAAKNYFHWMLETLARIHLLKQSKVKIDRYIVNHRSFPFQLETLAACGIPPEKIIQPDDSFHLQAKNLVIPSYVNLPNKWSCGYVRNLLLFSEKMKVNKKYERIYIQRQSSRRVINKNEIGEILKKAGFKILTLENMPLKKQIEAFYSAKVVVSPHGAGLANLVFCKPKTKVIELFSPSYMEPHYWLISRFMDLNYHFIVGTREDPHHYWSGFDNMSIDPNKLMKMLTRHQCL